MSITTAMNTPSADTMAPTLHHVLCPGASRDDAQTHRMAYWEWGRAEHPHWVICVHGLSRQGRDFDALARQLSKTHWVICPDIVGRGESDWLAEPGAYQLPSYVTDVVVLLRALRERRLAALGSAAPAAAPDLQWVGTSMGGLIGLGLGSLADEVSGVRLSKLVLNDVGPRLQPAALQRIGEYLGQPRVFESQQAAADYLWSISNGFGPHTAQEWMDLSLPLLRRDPQSSGWILHYDPAIAAPFKRISAEDAAAGELALWQAYDGLRCEVLLLRGQQSDLLDAQTAQAMVQRRPGTQMHEFAGVGHAPTLIHADQIAAVQTFLES